MSSSASLSQGSTIAIQSGTSYINIAQVEGFTGPGTSTDLIDITNLDSDGGYKEYVAGLKDNEPCTFDLVWKQGDTGITLAIAANTSGTLCNFKNTFAFSSAYTASYAGYVTKFSPKAQKGDVMRASIEIKPTGPITWA